MIQRNSRSKAPVERFRFDKYIIFSRRRHNSCHMTITVSSKLRSIGPHQTQWHFRILEKDGTNLVILYIVYRYTLISMLCAVFDRAWLYGSPISPTRKYNPDCNRDSLNWCNCAEVRRVFCCCIGVQWTPMYLGTVTCMRLRLHSF